MGSRKLFVEYFYPENLEKGPEVFEVEKRDLALILVPDSAYAFRFFDRLIRVIDGEELQSKNIEVSPMYYYGGRVMNLGDVMAEMPDEEILIYKMYIGAYSHIIQNRFGDLLPFLENDVLRPLR